MDNKPEITIEEVKDFSQDILESVRFLTKQLDDNFQPLTEEDFKSAIVDSNNHLFVAQLQGDQKIIGMITLIVYRIPYKKKAQLEDIVVDSAYRGQGIGTKLMQYAIESAKKLEVKSLNFTSGQNRELANQLYQRLGFEKRNTNVYRIDL